MEVEISVPVASITLDDEPTPPQRNYESVRGLTDGLLARLKCGKTIADTPARVNSVDFSADGMAMIVANAGDSIAVYNMHNGLKDKSVCVNSKKYGAGLVRYAGSPNAAIHSSTKIDNNLRYLNLHDNKYIRYFQGHTARVTCLHVSPSDDKVVSGANDKTVRLWDLRIQHCQGVMEVVGRPIANFDLSGEILVVAPTGDSIRMFDMRNWEKGPFALYKYTGTSSHAQTVNVDFSQDGKYILQNTNDAAARVIDYMTGAEVCLLRGHKNHKRNNLEASFSPDGNYVFSPSSDGYLYGWRIETGAQVAKVHTNHDSAMKICRWSPRHAMLVTTCSKISFWTVPQDTIPDSMRIVKEVKEIKEEIKEEIVTPKEDAFD